MADATPADMSLELNRPQKRIREVLRDLYGTLPDDTTRWILDDVRADAVRAHFASEARLDGRDWTLEVGDTVRRRDLHRAYGGQEQGGIATPRSIPDILIFTDARSGAAFGYDTFEGIQPDGSYWYTGEGQQGDQVFERGNKALRDAEANGRPIRLLVKDGVYVTYAGQFVTGEPPFVRQTIADVDRNPRDGIIFNLVPVVADLTILLDSAEPAAASASVFRWSPPDASDFVVGQQQLHIPEGRVVSRLEFDLQARFGHWASRRGTPPSRLRLDVAATSIEPDLYIEEEGWVVEAKKSSGRAYVRTAIGQVLDYVHNARAAGVDRAVPVILLPGRPEQDLMELMLSLGITVAFSDGDDFQLSLPVA